MFLKQIYLKGLGCMTYLVGDEETGEAAVVDAPITINETLREAEAAGLRVRHAIDTHLHADHLSGAVALAREAGATVHLPRKARAAYAHEGVQEGSEIRLGSVLLRFRETPGHTPEHVSVEVVDLARGSEAPYAVLTGDTLFVGSAGRPDLVAARDARALAADLYESFRGTLCALPDGTAVYPGHGAGSACGANMSHVLVSTIGYEKAVNPFLAHAERDAFVRHVTTDLPPKPGNATNLKRLNTEGPPARAPRAEDVPALDPDAFERAAADAGSVLVLDASEPDAFSANHVPGSVNVAVSPATFANRVAYLLEWDLPVLLVLQDDDDLQRALDGLARVGGLDVRGYLEDGMHAWRNAGKPVASLGALGAREAHREIAAGARLLDVRTDREWREGHVEGATHATWEDVVAGRADLDRDAEWVVACGSGYRSAIAASVLRREGYDRVANLLGGMGAWRAAGLPLERPRETRARAR